MPIYTVQGPDGKVYKIEGPAGATAEQLGRVIAGGGGPSPTAPTTPPVNPAQAVVDDMSGPERVLAGVGSAFARLGRGAGQRLGMYSQQEVDEANRLDAPLLSSVGGMGGNIAGNIAAALPTLAIPGAATIPGAGVIGAVQGALTPTSTGESALQNAGIGAAAGAGGIVAGRVLNAAVQGGRALVEPFTAAGRNRIGGRVLEQFGVPQQAVQGLSGNPTATGARLTLAEAIPDPQAAAGAARLQGALRSADPRTAAQMTAREVENNGARVNVLRQLSGVDGARDAAVAARGSAAEPLYNAAFQVDAGTALTPELQREMTALMRSPAISQAAREARRNAANAGMNVGPSNGSGSIEGLHNVKLALDDMIAQARGGGGTPAQATRAQALEEAQRRLVGFIEQLSPDYSAARTTYAQMSLPINQMDVAGELLNRGTSATSDLAGNPRLMPNALLSALGDEEALIRRATGRRLGGLDDVLDPAQASRVRGVGQELDRAAAVARAENGPGSATAQRLASQNVLRQTLGPLGAPESWSESVLLNTLMRPVQFAYNQVAEPRIQQVLADAILDPSKAALLSQAANAPGRLQNNRLLELLSQPIRLAPSSAATQW